MEKMFSLLCPLFLVIGLSAQPAPPDVFATDAGELKITPILHGTLVMEWNSEVIYIDPYGGAKSFEGIADPTLILITDIHGDHLNMKTLEIINLDKASLVAPPAVKDQLPESMKASTSVIRNNETKQVNGITITAIPMYNLPETDESRHPKGRGNGYILDLGGKKVYISGDTEDIPEMRSLTNIDIAFICMNQPYTMNIEQAADATRAFKPAIVYPYHYRGKDGLSDVERFKYLVDDGNALVEVRLRNWYPN